MRIKASTAAAAALLSGTVHAESIAGRLEYPSESLPAMTVVARNLADGSTTTIDTRAGQSRYRLTVAAGTYTVFAIPKDIPAAPGQVPLRGAHTAYSICARDKARLQGGACRTGPLVEVRVTAGAALTDVDIDDWYLPDALMATLNIAPATGALHFSDFPADTGVLPVTRGPGFANAAAEVRANRARVERAAVTGPHFAGRVAVARWGCGEGCEHWALIDMVTGEISWIRDSAVQPLRLALPCLAEPLEYRLESRLLRVSRRDGERVVTRHYLWSDDVSDVEYARETAMSVEQFCASRR